MGSAPKDKPDLRPAPTGVIGAASAGLALACLALIASILNTDPTHIDSSLKTAISAFALALPPLILAGIFAVWLDSRLGAFLIAVCGGVLFTIGLYFVLVHLFVRAGNQFLLSMGVCTGVLLLGLVIRAILARRGRATP